MSRPSTSAPAGVPTRKPTLLPLLLATCCGALFLYAAYLGAVSVALPAIGAAFGEGSAVAARLFPTNFTGFVVGVLLCGYLSDRWGRRAVLLLSLSCYGTGLLVFGLAATLPVALVASVVIGFGSGALETVASALAADLYPHRRALVLNLAHVAFGVGAACSPALAHVALTSGWDWRALYLVLAAATGLLFLALGAQRLPRAGRTTEAVDTEALRQMLRSRWFVAVCTGMGLYVGAEIGFFSWLPTYYDEVVTGGDNWSGLVVTVFWTAMTVGRLGAAAVVSRVDGRALILVLSAAGAVSSALVLVPAPLVLTTAWVACAGLAFSGLFAILLGESSRGFAGMEGTAFGGAIALGGVGGALVPWLIGIVGAGPLGWSAALGVVPVCMAGVSAAVFLGAPTRFRREPR
ncbi:MFS transporter [Geodermatophilus sp. SYSU D01186]